MKYSAEQVKEMSYAQWMESIAQELNDAGFKARGYNPEIGKHQDNYAPYEVGGDPDLFFMGTLRDVKALEYLKEIGLVNNGRCPLCGNVFVESPGRFTSGYDPDFHFQICQSCVSKGKKYSVNPMSNSGCLVSLLFLPWNLIRSLLEPFSRFF